MLSYILWILSFFFTIYGLYYVITGVCAFLKPKNENVEISKINKFSIIIAARNEDMVIGNLIDSLKKQNYDKDAFDINVIVNNSTDKTYEV